MQFSRSARFIDNKLAQEVPGPGDYDPQDLQKKTIGVVNFAADSIQRFAPDKENDVRLGPGYYQTPTKNPVKSRRSSIASCMFSDARKKLDGSRLTEDAISELSEKLRESNKAFEAESARALDAENKLKATQLSYYEEVTKRNTLQEKLENLEKEQKAEKEQYEQMLKESNEKIHKIEKQVENCVFEKKQAEEQIVLLTSQMSALQNARDLLDDEKRCYEERVLSLEKNLQEISERETLLDAQMRESQELAEKRRVDITTQLLPKIEALSHAHSELSTKHQLHIEHCSQLAIDLQQRNEQCNLLQSQVQQSEVESKAYKSEIELLQHHLSTSKQYTQQLNENIKEKQTQYLHTQQQLDEETKKLEEKEMCLLSMRKEYEKREQNFNHEKSLMCEEMKNEIEKNEKEIEEMKKIYKQTQDNLFCVETKMKEENEVLKKEIEMEKNKIVAFEKDIEEKEKHYSHTVSISLQLQQELEEKKEKIIELEKKVSNAKIWQSTAQNLKTQLDENMHAFSELEKTIEKKEKEYETFLSEKQTYLEKLTNQMRKKNNIILEQKNTNDVLGENQRVLTNKNIALEKQYEMQKEVNEREKKELHAQITHATSALEKVRSDFQDRMNTLLQNVSFAEAQIKEKEKEMKEKESFFLLQFTQQTEENKKEKETEIEIVRQEINIWKEKYTVLEKNILDEKERFIQKEKKLEEEKQDSEAEKKKCSEEISVLQTRVHEIQQNKENLIGKLGTKEMHIEDLLLRINAYEKDMKKYTEMCEMYEKNLLQEKEKNEKMVVEVANKEMEMESVKKEFDSSMNEVREIRERFLHEQALSSEFEAKYMYEKNTIAKNLSTTITQQEETIQIQKEEIVSLKNQIEKEKMLCIEKEHEKLLKENFFTYELSLRQKEIDTIQEKNKMLEKEKELNEYKINMFQQQKDENEIILKKNETIVKNFEIELQQQQTNFFLQLEEKNKQMGMLQEKNIYSTQQQDILEEENRNLKRVHTLDVLTHERAVHAAMANLEITRQDLHAARSLCTQQITQIKSLNETILSLKTEKEPETSSFLQQQQCEKLQKQKEEAVKNYTSLLKSFHNKNNECEEKESIILKLEEEKTIEKQQYKEMITNIEKENMELNDECVRLSKFMEENREAMEKVHELRARVSELEVTNQTLQDSLVVLGDQAKETSSQNASLVGHNNQKQKINIHAKVMEENRKLKLENIRLSNSLHELKKNTATSFVVSDTENIAPTPVRGNVMLQTPASARIKSSRKQIELEDETNTTTKSGPLQEGFKAWQQKKQKALGTAEKRTPLARLSNGVPRQSLITPQKMVGLH